MFKMVIKMKYKGRVIGLLLSSLIAALYFSVQMNDFSQRDFYLYCFTTALVFGIFYFFGKTFDQNRYTYKQLKVKEWELSQNHHSLKNIFETIDICLWTYEPIEKTYNISGGTEKILGYSNDCFLNNTAFWRRIIHPNDQRLIDTRLKKILKHETVSTEYRVIHPDGKIRWVLDKGAPSYSDNGDLLSFSGVILDITERKNTEKNLNYIAYHDNLTGLFNREFLYDHLNDMLLKKHVSPFAIMFIDLDRFKIINDTMGHNMGDILLQEVTTRLKASLREKDIATRHGGDEFVVIIKDATVEMVEEIVTLFLSKMESPFKLETVETYTTPSIGISMYPKDGEDSVTLIKNADKAMYKVKEQGKNGFQFYDSSISDINTVNLNLEPDLRKALTNNEFMLFYQPQIDLNTNRILGVEVLLRWEHPIYGMIPPMDFIPLAEETGLIIPIGQWVLEHACIQAKAWQDGGLLPIRIGVNVSVLQFREVEFVQNVKHALQKSNLEPQYLDIEITESLMQNIQQSMTILKELKQMGVNISLDDFGTGWSSLSVIKNLPIDTLKIDWSFMYDIPKNENSMHIVKTMIEMGHNLNIQVIAEGIEKREQIEFLRSNKCLIGQGFYYSHPIPANTFEEMLKEQKKVLN